MCIVLYTSTAAPISERPFDISILSNNNTVSLYCTSSTLQLNCFVQYTVDHHYDNLSVVASISNDAPLILPAINNTRFNFEIAVIMSPTLEIVVKKTHLHRLQQEILCTLATPSSEGNLVLETHFLGAISSIVAVLIILLIIAAISICFLLYRGKY